MKSIIEQLRKLLSSKKLDGFLVPMRDEFGSEYVPAQYRRLEFISGFTGSAGSAIILKNKAAFFTDGRYTLQAAKQVDSKIFEIYDSSEKSEIDFLKENSKKNKLKIGYDSSLFSENQLAKYRINNLELIECENLIDKIWSNKPAAKKSEVFILDKKFSGKNSTEKISEIIKNLEQDFFIFTNPESICWLLNIRAHDLPNTPVKLGYAIVSKQGNVIFYPLENNIDNKTQKNIGKNLSIKNFDEFFADLKIFKGKNIAIDLTSAPIKISNILKNSGAKIFDVKDPTIILRAIKNQVEIENIKLAHIKDGIALTKFFCWLEQNIKTNSGKTLTEISIAEKLEIFRKENKNFLYPSFDTIAGYAENGAIIHYHATEKSAKKLQAKNILLLDSGGQYLEGTTDVTRTIALGKVTKEQKRNFALVLKGHIAIASAKFPKGTSGAQIDSLARIALWREGKDYKHGTGHGVGFCLNVHEGPHGISKHYQTPLQAGMVVSNEPGYYLKNQYGIRIENLILVKNSKIKSSINQNFLEFENLTQAPIDINLIDKNLLNKNEISWLNNYHAEVYNKLVNSAEGKNLSSAEKIWLKKATRKI